MKAPRPKRPRPLSRKEKLYVLKLLLRAWRERNERSFAA